MCPLLRQGESCPRGAVRADLARFRVVLRGRAKWAPGETQWSGFATERQSSGMSECTYGTETKDKEFATTRSRIKAGVAGGISGQSKLPAVRAVTGALRCIKSGVKLRPVVPSLRSLSPNPCCHNEKTGVTLQKGAVDRQERGNRLLASPSKPSALGCPQKLRRNETKETIFSAGRWIREM